jgi:hypothetical protein
MTEPEHSCSSNSDPPTGSWAFAPTFDAATVECTAIDPPQMLNSLIT